jgi:2-amino-4-hydroxy-6-hydroxymethyldihydropteridine diphosphokinase
LVALGSNATISGIPPKDRLNDALTTLEDGSVKIRKTSRFYKTPCFPPGAGPDYVNAAIAVETSLSASEVLSFLHRIEAGAGRLRDLRWGARTLDLDLIAQGASVLPDRATFEVWRDLPLARQQSEAPDTLVLPHPRLQDRAFVLIPLCDVAPDWRHPVSGLSVREMVDALPAADKNAIVPL